MFLEKVFDVTIDVKNPINFCADKERHLQAELRNNYLGRCYKGAYITRIKKILHASSCRIVSTNATCEGVVDVQFLAEVAVFSKWDILVGVQVVSQQQMVVGRYEAPSFPDQEIGAKNAQAVVSLLASNVVETLAVGQTIPVRVVAVQHQPMQTQVSIVGVLLACDSAAPVYRLHGKLDQAARMELAPLLEAVDAELRAREALIATRKPDVWFFELLLYAFRSLEPTRQGTADQVIPTGGPSIRPPGRPLDEPPDEPSDPSWTGPWGLQSIEEGASPQNVLEIVRRVVRGETVAVSGCWSRPLALYRSSPLVAVAEERPRDDGAEGSPGSLPVGWQPAVEGTPRAVFAEFLKNILDFLTAVRELVELYNTRELIDKHRSVWTVMRAKQKPIGAKPVGATPVASEGRAAGPTAASQ